MKEDLPIIYACMFITPIFWIINIYFFIINRTNISFILLIVSTLILIIQLYLFDKIMHNEGDKRVKWEEWKRQCNLANKQPICPKCGGLDFVLTKTEKIEYIGIQDMFICKKCNYSFLACEVE